MSGRDSNEWRRSQPAREPTDSLREQLAEYAHKAWSRWMKYFLERCHLASSGRAVFPAGPADRWRRQMKTPYRDLPEDEKESDREQADEILGILERARMDDVAEHSAKPRGALKGLAEWIERHDWGCTQARTDLDTVKQWVIDRERDLKQTCDQVHELEAWVDRICATLEDTRVIFDDIIDATDCLYARQTARGGRSRLDAILRSGGKP